MFILFLILVGLCLACLIRIFVKKDAGDTLLASIIFVPALLYWSSGQNVSELAGFGFSAKFHERLNQKISLVGQSLEDLSIFSLSSNDPDFKVAAFFEECADYYVLRESSVPSEADALNEYIVNASYAIKGSIACGKLIGIIVLDDHNKYIGSYDREFYAEALSIWAVPADRKQVSKEILASMISTTTIFGASMKFPEKRIRPGEGFTAAINENATVEQAFQEFRETGVDFLVITDALGQFEGVMTYRSVTESILGALFESS